MADKKFSVTYYQTPKDVFSPWSWKKLNNGNKCQKNIKKSSLSKSAYIHDVKNRKPFHYH